MVTLADSLKRPRGLRVAGGRLFAASSPEPRQEMKP